MWMSFLPSRSDGLILSPVAGDHSYLNRYLENDARMVFVNRHIPGFHCPSVVTDDEEAMYQLASQLLASGHRRLAAIIGLESVSTTASRIDGLRRALATVGLTLDDVQLIQGHSRREGGYQAARSVMAMPHQPTAVISFNSIMLDGFLLGLLDLAPHLIPENRDHRVWLLARRAGLPALQTLYPPAIRRGRRHRHPPAAGCPRK